jgi:CheY-like chemotaxis protein
MKAANDKSATRAGSEHTDDAGKEEEPMIVPLDRTFHFRPTLVLGHPDEVYAAAVSRQLRLQGWEVYLTMSGPEARRLVRRLAPAAVVLAAAMLPESGWLTCAKLTRELPGARVVLVSQRPTPDDRRFSHFVGAKQLVDRDAGAKALVDALSDAVLPTVG